jgi:uncharacterized protein (TIGR00255 family)
MIKSMTGYSRREAETDFGKLIVEIKSWNHRYCNIVVRLPEILSRFEHQVYAAVKNRIARGQIQATIELGEGETALLQQKPRLDMALAEAYHQALIQMKTSLALEGEVSLSLMAQLPGVLTALTPEIDEEAVWRTLQSLLDAALDQLELARRAEGATMLAEIENRRQSIQSHTEAIRSASVNLVELAQARLEKRLNELFQGQIEIDHNRLVMEVGVIATRADITEELVRLDSHCVQLAEYLQMAEPVGRQLDFLMQEMNREVNTIASKAAQAPISAACVALKTEIEKIRELAQNVE